MSVKDLFSPKDREHVLITVLDKLKSDERLAGVIVVGSGAIGFEDVFSDIDLCVVVEKGENLMAVFADIKSFIFCQTLPGGAGTGA